MYMQNRKKHSGTVSRPRFSLVVAFVHIATQRCLTSRREALSSFWVTSVPVCDERKNVAKR